MKYYVAIKTSIEESYPNVIKVAEKYNNALEAIIDNVEEESSYELTPEERKEIEEEIEENSYYDFKGYKYSISKYWE